MAHPQDRVVAKLQALVRIPTVSDRDPALIDVKAFDHLLTELADQFPLLHMELELTRVGTHGLLFHWPGDSTDRPVVLMAHLDVVPIDHAAPWQHPPFGAEIHDGSIWGRGTLDDKGCVVAICEAVELLLEAGESPVQDVWLSFGCDEEVSGTSAQAAVSHLKERGVTPWFVLDEGGAIAHQAFPGVEPPLGVIGVTEKGTTSVELVAEGRGGHASTPARNGPTARIARAILRIEKNPFPASAPAPTLELLRRLSPYLPGSILAWLLVAAGLALFVPFVQAERRIAEPLIDIDLLATRAQWPVQLTAFLFGMSVLGAQIPLSTFARTDPDVVGYGLGADAGFVSTLIGVYVVSLAIGAFTLPVTSRWFTARGALIGSSVLVAIGYAMWIPFHDSTTQALINMGIAGIGSGALVAALPAAAAAAAPADRTGFATGMTNATKTVGGAIASSIFAIALASTGSLSDPTEGHAPLSGYLTVWAVCSVAALFAAVALFAVPKTAFRD